MIELKKISKRYRYQGHTIDILTDVDLQIGKGEAVCVRAPSGRGKTTLLNIIGCMLTPTAGTLEVNGVEVTGLPHHFRSAFRRDHIGFIFQQFNLMPHFTVLENLLFPLLPTGKKLDHETKRIEEILARLQIDHRKSFTVNLLSGGEQQRVAVARALVNDPAVVIADEPFSNLDPKNSALIVDILAELKAAGKTLVLSSTAERAHQEAGLIDRDIML